MVWYGMVWYGMVWYGMVWYGMVWYGMPWYAIVWYMIWCGAARHGMVWYSIILYCVMHCNKLHLLLPSYLGHCSTELTLAESCNSGVKIGSPIISNKIQSKETIYDYYFTNRNTRSHPWEIPNIVLERF